jgi:hydroxyethylthiazole kinase-like uncharacterized protein yjeF
MQKVFQNCYGMDERCYKEYGLSEDILMEHAAEAIASYIRENFSDGSTILIVSGAGNNGADGITLARLLYRRFEIELIVPFGTKSTMAKLQLQRANNLGITSQEAIASGCRGADVVVDALFGAGLNRELDGQSQSIIGQLNRLNGFKIACDIPSGVSHSGRLSPIAFMADVTITMGALKEALYMDEIKDYVGDIVRAELGVDRKLYEEHSDTFVLERSDMCLPTRDIQATHKGTFGHIALLCGEKEGAAVMAGLAALRFGAGLATLVIHKNISPTPTLMSSTVVPSSTSALAVGMGLGSYFESEFLQKYIVQNDLPLLLDADSFYSQELLLSLENKGRNIVLTPHPKEFVSLWRILTGEEVTTFDIQKNRLSYVREFSKLYPQVVLLLKGANMLIAHQNRVWINPLGTSRLSKGGSGDVLSGLISSLLAQGYDALEATIQGSLALVVAAQNYNGASYAMLATDLIEQIETLEKG